MKHNFACPYCDGTAALDYVKKVRDFRGETYRLFEAYYKCNKCNQEFTTEKVDQFNFNQVYNQYRERYNIPFPEQLKSVREKYELTYNQISEILGIGINQFRLYEKGELPTASNATLLSLIINPEGLKDIILHKQNYQNQNYFNDLLFQIDNHLKEIKRFDIKNYLFNSSIIPNKFTGYTLPDFEKFANIALLFIKSAPFKVRLNKYLFYADFLYYKYFGKSISGCIYVALPLGPVPDNYSLIYGLLERENFISTELVDINSKEHDKFIPQKDFDKSLFNEDELSILNFISKEFESKSTQELWQLSHDELAWKENINRKGIIDYLNYAPQLIAH
jgi:putative zinc finger/helix-turn-helix YgiT family protein